MSSRQIHDDLEEKKKKRNSVFEEKLQDFKKEITELDGSSVGFICHAPDGQVHVWPEDRKSLSDISAKFNAQTDLEKKKNSSDLRDFPDPHLFDGLSLEELKEHLSIIDSHLDGIRKKKIEIMRKRDGSSFSS